VPPPSTVRFAGLFLLSMLVFTSCEGCENSEDEQLALVNRHAQISVATWNVKNVPSLIINSPDDYLKRGWCPTTRTVSSC